MKLLLPAKLQELVRSDKRFIVIYGGRGSGKSWGVADFLISKSVIYNSRILCAREVQNSIRDSVKKLLTDRITYYGLDHFFHVTDTKIIGANGSEFIFKGLSYNSQDIKSLEGIDLCWLEEAQTISKKSLALLTPTVRKPGSQLIFTYNPTKKEDPVHAEFTLVDREDTLKIEMNYMDNPFFPGVLLKELEYDKKVDYEKYLHVWHGQCVTHSEEQIFHGKWEVKEFPDDWNISNRYIGVDFGFSQDPTCGIMSYIKDGILYICYEASGKKIDIDKTGALLSQIPRIRQYNIKGDSARPESISYLRREGFRITGAIKGAGSIIEGITHLRSFANIVIHPRCKGVINEFKNYSWKRNQHTEEILNVAEDKNNHFIDALRYSLEAVMRNRKGRVTQTIGW